MYKSMMGYTEPTRLQGQRMRHNRVAFLPAAVLLAVIAACTPSPQTPASIDSRIVHYPDLVILNAKVITVDDQSSVQEAVAARDGKFLAVGSTAEIRKLVGPSTRVIEAGGKTVLPGLVDTHLHLLQGALHWKNEVRVDAAKSLEDVFDAIKARAAQTSPGTWILIRGGWHWSQIRERRMPTREELDAIAPNHPVHVQAGYDVIQLNSLGIKTANLAGRKDIPPAIKVEKDAKGNPTGVLHGFPAMLWAINAYFPPETFEEKIEQMRIMMREFNAAGLTGIIEGAAIYDDADYQAMFEMWRRGNMTLRVGMQVDSVDAKRALNWIPHMAQGLGDDMLWVNSLGEVIMGAVWDSAPGSYPLKPEVRSAFKQVVEAAAANHISVQIDSVTEPGLSTMLDIFEEVHAKIPIDKLRFTLIHAEQITPPMIERMKKLGMGVMIQARQLIRSDSMREQYGPRMDDEPIIKTVYDSGLPFSGGTDGTVANTYLPFPSLYWYVSGRNLRGEVVRKTQKLTREEALRVYSRNTAWFSFQEKKRGPIAPGYLADMILVDKDYMTVPEEEIPSIRPIMTIVGGNVVYEAQESR
jgi:predicted amidohydrolase YtcJ